MMADQQANEMLRLGAIRVHVIEGVVAPTLAAGIWSLSRIIAGICEKSVLETVNTNLCSLRIRDGAQMAGYLEAAPVCLLDDRAQLRARDMRVRFEGGHPAIRPVCDGLACILGAIELLNLRDRTARSIQIRARHIQMRTGTEPLLNGLFEP